MALVITMKAKESVIITTVSGDKVRIELPHGTTKQSRICFFAEDKIKIERVKKDEIEKFKTCKYCYAVYEKGCPQGCDQD
jgi:ribosomal protein L1